MVLARYKHLDDIPMEPGRWEISVRGRANLLRTLADRFEDALLYRRLATLDTTAPTITSVD